MLFVRWWIWRHGDVTTQLLPPGRWRNSRTCSGAMSLAPHSCCHLYSIYICRTLCCVTISRRDVGGFFTKRAGRCENTGDTLLLLQPRHRATKQHDDVTLDRFSGEHHRNSTFNKKRMYLTLRSSVEWDSCHHVLIHVLGEPASGWDQLNMATWRSGTCHLKFNRR